MKRKNKENKKETPVALDQLLTMQIGKIVLTCNLPGWKRSSYNWRSYDQS